MVDTVPKLRKQSQLPYLQNETGRTQDIFKINNEQHSRATALPRVRLGRLHASCLQHCTTCASLLVSRTDCCKRLYLSTEPIAESRAVFGMLSPFLIKANRHENHARATTATRMG